MAVDHNNPQSRNEEILIATIDGKEYNKPPQSRIEELLLELKEVIETGSGGGGINPIGVTTTPLYDGATTNPIQINGESYTAETGDMVTYQSTEFLFNVNEVWQELGDVSVVLAIIDNIFADIAPTFSASSTYAVGDYVIYNDQLYKCITAHTGAWDENNFAATTISDEIADVSDAVDKIKDGTDIGSFADVETALADKVNKVNGKGLSTNDYDNTEKAAVAAATSAISTIKDGVDIDSFGDVEVALLDKADISDLGTAAAKDSTNSVTSGSTDLVESGAVKDAIDAAVAAAYHHAGTKTVAQLTHDLLVAANEGNVYNITDSGTTTSDFIEGIGKTINEGSNVGICKVGNVYMFDLLSGFVDTTNFVQKSQTAGLLKNDGTVNDEIEDDVDALTEDVGDIKSKIDDSTTYPYADVITIEDAVPANLADCKVKIEPDQDLHGFDHPWVGGASKNKINIADKASSTSGDVTASCSNGVITLSGTASAQTTFSFPLGSDINLTPSLYKIAYNNTAASSYIAVKFCNDGSVIHSWTPNVVNRVISDWTAAEDETIDEIKIEIATGYPTNMTLSIVVMDKDGTDTSFSPYENLCPISGHTEASVQRDGKNWFDYTKATANYRVNIDNGNLEFQNGFYASDYIEVFVQQTFTLNYAYSSLAQYGIAFYDANKTFVSGRKQKQTEGDTTFTYTVPNGCKYVRFTVPTDITVSSVQMELGSSATDYEPFKGKTYTIALGDTIYGGTVRIDSNGNTVMDVYDVKKVFNGSEDEIWTTRTTQSGYTIFEIVLSDTRSSTLQTQVGLCNEFPWSITYVTDKSYRYYQTTLGIRYDGLTLAEFKEWLSSNELEVTLPLATPTTIQLTPQQIQLLKGTNTLTASTGQISVTVNGVAGAIGQVQEQVNELDGEIGDINSVLSLKTATAGTNITIVKGGYLQIGKLVIIDVIVTAGDNISINNIIINNIPSVGDNNYPISCNDVASPWSAANVRIYYGGVVNTDQLTSGHSYHIYGSYMCN